jgi:four helix bundle protein
MGDYKSLKIWQRSHALTLEVYKATTGFPKAEQYGITAQLRRASSSVPANLAEGAGRNTQPEMARFCRIALGSANEVEYHLLLARDLGYLEAGHYQRLVRELRQIKNMIARFVHALAVTDN